MARKLASKLVSCWLESESSNSEPLLLVVCNRIQIGDPFFNEEYNILVIALPAAVGRDGARTLLADQLLQVDAFSVDSCASRVNTS